jgi:hypothetical protein
MLRGIAVIYNSYFTYHYENETVHCSVRRKGINPNNFNVKSCLLMAGAGFLNIVHWVSKKLKCISPFPAQIHIPVIVITGFIRLEA